MTSAEPTSFEPTRSDVLACLLSGEETDVQDLAARTGLSPSTVFRSVDQLLQVPDLLQRRVARRGGRGRPTTKVKLNRRFAMLVGIVLDSAVTRFVLTDLLGQARGERRVKTPPALTPAALADWVATETRALVADAGDGSRLGAVAVGLPGALTPDQQEVVGSHNLPIIVGPAFIAHLQHALDVPVRFENDSHAALLGELSYGSVDASGAVVLVTMSTGVSAAVSVGGEILVGSTGSVGEFGRLVVAPDGTRVEDLLSEAGLAAHVRTAGGEQGEDPHLPSEIDRLPGLRQQVDAAFEHLLGIVALAYEPHTILITGAFSALFDEPRLATLARRLEDQVLVRSDVRRADLGDDSALLGTIALASAAQFAELGVSDRQLGELPPATLDAPPAADTDASSADGERAPVEAP